MDKEQALNEFWNSFGIPAYDEATVPDKTTMPYITYSMATGSLGDVIPLTATIWYYSSTWKEITQKKDEIATRIGIGGQVVKLDNGYMWLCRGTTFAQRIPDASDNEFVRAYYLQLQAEFLTEN